MKVEEAIQTAIQYENRVRDVYYTAAKHMRNPSACRVLSVLADEEQHHVDYLEAQLSNWKDTGRLSMETLETVVPAKNRIKEGVSRLKEHMNVLDKESEIQALEQALKLEKETSDFYEQMVRELTDEAQRMFARFLEIENGHLAVVRAELDSVRNMGFWFDFREFNLEVEG